MEQHVLAILGLDDLWDWPPTEQQELGEQGRKFQAVAPKFLCYLIKESQRFGGSVLDHFWKQLGKSDHEKLKENSQSKTLMLNRTH